jgi:hypothetical protein
MKDVALPTATAHWGWDDHRYFGHRVFEDLAGRQSLTSLTALSVLGRQLSCDECAVLDDAAVCLTLADPRIWPLKLTRVIAAHGGMTASAAAGLLIEEDARIGPWTGAKSAELLVELHLRLVGTGFDAEAVEAVVREYLDKHHFVWGFGTPFRQRDERLVAFVSCLERRGRRQLPFMRTLDAVALVVTRLRQTEPNMGMAFAAAFLDLGLAVEEVGPLATALMQHMFFAHAVEGARQAPTVLQCLPEPCIDYIGVEARDSPRAAAERAMTKACPSSSTQARRSAANADRKRC